MRGFRQLFLLFALYDVTEQKLLPAAVQIFCLHGSTDHNKFVLGGGDLKQLVSERGGTDGVHKKLSIR